MKRLLIIFGSIICLICGFLLYPEEQHEIIKNSKNSISSSGAMAILYETEADSGEYQVSGDDVWGKEGYIFNEELSKCENGSKIYYDSMQNKIFVETNMVDRCYVYFDKYGYYLNKKILEDNPTVLTRTNFDMVFTEENVGTIYTVSGNRTEDIDGDGNGESVYYFAGNSLNNWVKFGKNENDEDLYWRIIRINEDGSIRLLYVGNSVDSTTAYVKTSMWSDIVNDAKYIGYMYGDSGEIEDNRLNTNDSIIKIAVDTWYEDTILSKSDDNNYTYDNYISRTAIYCNDRASDDDITWELAGFVRLWDYSGGAQPSFRCGTNKNGSLTPEADVQDKFTVSDITGNGNLKYPVALMTSDEIAYAGGWNENSLSSPYAYYYLNANGESVTGTLAWWTMTPRYIYGSFIISGSGNPGYLGYVYNNRGQYGVRPVLSLKSCVYWSNGDGSSTNPYEVFIDNTCSGLDN